MSDSSLSPEPDPDSDLLIGVTVDRARYEDLTVSTAGRRPTPRRLLSIHSSMFYTDRVSTARASPGTVVSDF